MSKSLGEFYSHRVANDDREAVRILDQFTKAFCIDAEVTDDLAFRCKECIFETEKGICLVKSFCRKFAPYYKDFGAMGDL